MDNLSDNALITEIKSGNVLAFEILVKKYQDRLLSFVEGRCHDRALSEEIVQDTFLKLYKTIDRVSPKHKFSSYLFQIAKNTTFDYQRKLKPTVPLIDAAYQTTGESMEENLHRKLEQGKTKKAISDLKKPQRQIIRLYYFDELSYKEISHKLSLPLNTVKTNLSRAKKALRKVLKYD
jgi:RNA polymerase sigma factor (sigma-70 family)